MQAFHNGWLAMDSLLLSTQASRREDMLDHLRICFVSTEFWPEIGGAAVRAQKQARQFRLLGHEMLIVTPRHCRKWQRVETLDGVRILRIGGIYKRDGWLRVGRLGHLPIDLGMLLTLWRLRRQYDVIHALQFSSFAAVAALIGKLSHKPVIVSIQSTGPGEAQRARLEQGATLMADTLTETGFLKLAEKQWTEGEDEISFLPKIAFGQAIVNFLRTSDAFYQVLSRRGYPYLTAHGFCPDRIFHIPGSVDTEKFRPALNRPTPEQPERNVVCVARLVHAKGVDVLLHAWGRMMREPAEWRAHLKPRLLLVGDGECRPQMERIAAELGIQDSVAFLGQLTDVIPLLQQSWAFVMPSRWEGMSNALLEAMACGLPCVATRVGGSEDLIEDGFNGLLVEPEKPIQMARALRQIIEDPDLARRLGQEARATVVRSFQLDTIARQCLELYRHLLREEKRSLPVGLENASEL
jgi:glycosyltransferase involved in cell wall biosynthesis